MLRQAPEELINLELYTTTGGADKLHLPRPLQIIFEGALLSKLSLYLFTILSLACLVCQDLHVNPVCGCSIPA